MSIKAMENNTNEKDTELQKRMLMELERVYEEMGRVPTVTELNELSTFSGKDYNDEFGSVCIAFTEADIPFRQQRIPDDELLKAIERLYERFDAIPKRIDMSEFGDYSGVIYQHRFGSWKNGLKKAGYNEIPTERAAPYPRSSAEKGTETIKTLVNRFNQPHTVEEQAVELFKKAAEKEILPGNNIVSVASACFVISCYMNDVGIPTKLIEETINQDDVTRQYRRLAQKLKLMVLPPDGSGYVDSVCNIVDISDRKKQVIDGIVEEYITDNENNANSPVTTVASAIYAVECTTENGLTQTMVAEKCGVTSMTIRKNYRDFFNYIDEEQTIELNNI